MKATDQFLDRMLRPFDRATPSVQRRAFANVWLKLNFLMKKVSEESGCTMDEVYQFVCSNYRGGDYGD